MAACNVRPLQCWVKVGSALSENDLFLRKVKFVLNKIISHPPRLIRLVKDSGLNVDLLRFFGRDVQQPLPILNRS